MYCFLDLFLWCHCLMAGHRSTALSNVLGRLAQCLYRLTVQRGLKLHTPHYKADAHQTASHHDAFISKSMYVYVCVACLYAYMYLSMYACIYVILYVCVTCMYVCM